MWTCCVRTKRPKEVSDRLLFCNQHMLIKPHTHQHMTNTPDNRSLRLMSNLHLDTIFTFSSALLLKNIIPPVFSVMWSSEISLWCWFAAGDEKWKGGTALPAQQRSIMNVIYLKTPLILFSASLLDCSSHIQISLKEVRDLVIIPNHFENPQNHIKVKSACELIRAIQKYTELLVVPDSHSCLLNIRYVLAVIGL